MEDLEGIDTSLDGAFSGICRRYSVRSIPDAFVGAGNERIVSIRSCSTVYSRQSKRALRGGDFSMATTVQQPTDTHPKWNAFVSLNWYDGLISFLFRFVAKTSEPLLAIGVIVSAADFLQKGQLMTNN